MEQMPDPSRELERIIAENTKAGKQPSLLMHACCAPCSSYVLEYLNSHFQMDMYYFNPNIDSGEEYDHRISELKRLVREMPLEYPCKVTAGEYSPQLFYQAVKGLEDAAEGGERCAKCFELRLRQTALTAVQQGYDYFSTTLTISPLKNSRLINQLGQRIAAETGVSFLPSDFKKKNGFKRSVELSKEYSLYRQNYCGCVFSKRRLENQNTAE